LSRTVRSYKVLTLQPSQVYSLHTDCSVLPLSNAGLQSAQWRGLRLRRRLGHELRSYLAYEQQDEEA
jgi:hypothetical protein